MPEYPLTTSSWLLIATAGSTVEVQNWSGSPARIIEAADKPLPSFVEGQLLDGDDCYRKYDAPLVGNLYAIASLARMTMLEVQLIGAASAAGSAGIDYSANAPALPLIGAAFGSSGPYANYVLVRTIPADPTRKNVDVENTSGAQIVIMRDDGTAPSGGTPTNASLIPLTGATDMSGAGMVGSQGGAWSSATFKGRLQIYAPSSQAQVSAFID